jgi:hypothetical protein
MSNAKHTPTPWKIGTDSEGHQPMVYSERGHEILICSLYSRSVAEAQANAAHIVKCVNGHEALVEALKEANNRISLLESQLPLIGISLEADRVQTLINKALSQAGEV